MKILCALGKYNYGDSSRGIGPEYAAFLPALKNLGHDTVHFELWDRSMFSDYAELNRKLLETVVRERPDMLLAVPLNYEIWLETLRMISDFHDVATVCWTTDDSWKYREVSRFVGHAYDAMTTTYPDAVPKYHRDGISNVLLTQWAAGSGNLNEPLPAAKCAYKVSFVGTAHGNRKRLVSKLRAKNVDISCFGYGWPHGPVDAGDVHRISRESVISLNFANSRGDNQIKARTFEVPGAGGFLLTEHAPYLENVLVPGKETDMFHTTDELCEKINFYLARPEKRDMIAWAGYERVCREHTYEMRLKEVADFTLRSKTGTGKTGGRQTVLLFEEIAKKHRPNRNLCLLRQTLVRLCSLVWGNHRGPRAARRLVFEASWRLFKEKTFSASGWPGRMFPEQ